MMDFSTKLQDHCSPVDNTDLFSQFDDWSKHCAQMSTHIGDYNDTVWAADKVDELPVSLP